MFNKQLNIGIIGLGTVGSGVVETLEKKNNSFKRKYNLEINILGISAKSKNKKRAFNVKKYKWYNNPLDIIDIKDFRPNMVVLFFYPRDNTSGCTREAKDFTENIKLFNNLNINVFGISKDSITSHEKFIKKQSLTIPLLSDEAGSVCEDFGVWKEKSMYGKIYMGIERSTFIIDGSGSVTHEWRKVKVANHVTEVLETVKKL